MLAEWEDIHAGARADTGVLSTEINHAVGEDAVLVHHVFADAAALAHYFSTTATEHMGPLRTVAKPLLEILAGIPTVVYGFFALTIITPMMAMTAARLGRGDWAIDALLLEQQDAVAAALGCASAPPLAPVPTPMTGYMPWSRPRRM